MIPELTLYTICDLRCAGAVNMGEEGAIAPLLYSILIKVTTVVHYVANSYSYFYTDIFK